MTYTTRVKEEIVKEPLNEAEKICELSGFLRFSGNFKDNISITLENASIARRIYCHFKEIFNVRPKITIRNQKRFRIKQIYILEINEKVEHILQVLCIMENHKKILPENYFFSTDEDIISYLQGVFLATGTINDPASSGYHLEIVTNLNREAVFISNLFKKLHINAKYLKSNSIISKIYGLHKKCRSN